MGKKNTISFLGDISLNDKYNELYQNGEKPFDEVKELLFNSGFVVGNLECMAKGDKGENLLKKPRLNTNLETLNYLNDFNLGLALLAHNHVYDNLEDGFLKTITFLQENNIAYIGAGLSQAEAEVPFMREIGNQKICILNYVTEDTNPNLPEDATVYLNWFKVEKVIAEIKKYKKQVDKVILCLHWGGRCEGGYYPDWDQPKIAKRLINAGVDLIVGGHSHTLQPFEIYKTKHIFYSLGNFCFADIYCDGKHLELEKGKRTESALLNVRLEDDFFKTLIGIENNNLHVCQNNIVVEKWNNRNNLFKVVTSNKLVWKLYYLKFKKIDPIVVFLFGNGRNPFKQLLKLNIKKAINHLLK